MSPRAGDTILPEPSVCPTATCHTHTHTQGEPVEEFVAEINGVMITRHGIHTTT
jgi:hypothetical protein